ncbi:hypothetical protein XM38_051960 [Halomicronema hongdechloris C2206]|uniref:Uncharacterized protein n=1 Tax=Halomicronema hongdechloris C2206 TaxID=1641165 RepID=A0A1Z3HV80_9CYAN|nr:hypothetical protein XM38_051960 [Halomicronema hongdechloris C2206]
MGRWTAWAEEWAAIGVRGIAGDALPSILPNLIENNLLREKQLI